MARRARSQLPHPTSSVVHARTGLTRCEEGDTPASVRNLLSVPVATAHCTHTHCRRRHAHTHAHIVHGAYRTNECTAVHCTAQHRAARRSKAEVLSAPRWRLSDERLRRVACAPHSATRPSPAVCQISRCMLWQCGVRGSLTCGERVCRVDEVDERRLQCNRAGRCGRAPPTGEGRVGPSQRCGYGGVGRGRRACRNVVARRNPRRRNVVSLWTGQRAGAMCVLLGKSH